MEPFDEPVNPIPSAERLPDSDLEQSPIAILRIAGNFIVPLNIPRQWEKLLPSKPSVSRSGGAVPAIPLRIEKRLLDPATNRTQTLTLSIEPSLQHGRVRVLINTNPMLPDRTWRAALAEAGSSNLIASVPLAEQCVELDTALPYGFYTLTLSGDGAPIVLKFAVEPFNLPEAIQTAQEYLSHAQYIRALAILVDVAERHPENVDVQDLLCLAYSLAASDQASYEAEQAEFGAFRSVGDFTKEASRAVGGARTHFGERLAVLIAGSALESEPKPAIGGSVESSVSATVLKTLALLRERLKSGKDAKNEALLQVLNVLVSRLESLETLNGELAQRVEAARKDAATSVDEKFVLISDALSRFSEQLAETRIAVPDYAPSFSEQIGEACWNWIGSELQRVFMTAEDLYRHQAGKSDVASRDFTPALLEFCRGFEVLLNQKLGGFCEEIQSAILGSATCTDIALRVMFGTVSERDPSRDEKSVSMLERALKTERSMSLSQIAIILRLAKAIHGARADLLRPELARPLAVSPGPGDIEYVAALNYIASELRNGKVHTSDFTPVRQIWLLRNLVFGLDEMRVSPDPLLAWVSRSWFKKDAALIRERLVETWSKFPGMVPVAWRAMNAPSARIAAA